MRGVDRGGRTPTVVTVVLLVLALVGAATVGALGTGRDPGTPPGEREYRSIAIFRNDDVQPYYRSDAMRAVDRIFVEEGVPVTQGVIPVIHGKPITETGDVCAYLREQARRHPGTFEFALHGYSHAERTDFGGASEFGGVPADTQREYVREGARIVDECTGERPRTFIPPFNTYDNATVAALAAENVTALSSIDWFERDARGRSGPFVAGGVRHVPATQGFVNWSAGSNNGFHERAALRRSFDRSYENGSVYVLMFHYTSFDTAEKRDRLRSFVRYTKSREGVGFMTVGEFAEAGAEGRLERTDGGWRYRPEPEPRRPEPVRTLCSLVGDERCDAVGLSATPGLAVGPSPAPTRPYGATTGIRR